METALFTVALVALLAVAAALIGICVMLVRRAEERGREADDDMSILRIPISRIAEYKRRFGVETLGELRELAAFNFNQIVLFSDDVLMFRSSGELNECWVDDMDGLCRLYSLTKNDIIELKKEFTKS